MTRRGQKEATRELLEAEDLSPPSLPLVLIALFFHSRGVSVSEKTAQSRKKNSRSKKKGLQIALDFLSRSSQAPELEYQSTMRATTPISHRRCSSAASKWGTQQRAAAPASPKRATTTSTSASNRPATATKTAAPPPPPPLASRLAAVALAATLALAPLFSLPSPAHARLEGVNKPELLPKEFTPVLDVAGFLTEGERARLRSQAEALEKDTGVKLRVLAQNYPETPGLAIKDYWGVDDDTVVFVVSARSFFSFFLSFFLSVHFLSLPLSLISHFSLSLSRSKKTKNKKQADPNTGNILNFNVGAGIDLRVPRTFWSRLAGKYGTKSYWTKNGEAVSIVNAVGAIDECLREPVGRLQCGKVGGPYVD